MKSIATGKMPHMFLIQKLQDSHVIYSHDVETIMKCIIIIGQSYEQKMYNGHDKNMHENYVRIVSEIFPLT